MTAFPNGWLPQVSSLLPATKPQEARIGVAACRKAWKVVRRLHPAEFDKQVPNPWEGVTKKSRTKGTKDAVSRDQVYAFAHGCIEAGKSATRTCW